MDKDYSFKKLLVWQKAKELVVDIYRITDKYPKSELFGLTSQMRRAAISVAANIVEGNSKRSKKYYLNFLNIAEASLAELDAYLEISLSLKFLKDSDCNVLFSKRKEVGYLLYRLIKSL